MGYVGQPIMTKVQMKFQELKCLWRQQNCFILWIAGCVLVGFEFGWKLGLGIFLMVGMLRGRQA